MDFRHHRTLAASPACTCDGDKVSYAGLNLPGTRWRSALAGLIGAPMRLRRYRHLHAEVIEDALSAYDCRAHRRERS